MVAHCHLMDSVELDLTIVLKSWGLSLDTPAQDITTFFDFVSHLGGGGMIYGLLCYWLETSLGSASHPSWDLAGLQFTWNLGECMRYRKLMAGFMDTDFPSGNWLFSIYSGMKQHFLNSSQFLGHPLKTTTAFWLTFSGVRMYDCYSSKDNPSTCSIVLFNRNGQNWFHCHYSLWNMRLTYVQQRERFIRRVLSFYSFQIVF